MNEKHTSAEKHADAIIESARDKTCAACRLPGDLDVGVAFLCGAVMLSSSVHGKRVPLCAEHERAIDEVATALVPILAIDAAIERIGEPDPDFCPHGIGDAACKSRPECVAKIKAGAPVIVPDELAKGKDNRPAAPPVLEPLDIKWTYPERCRACKRSLRLGDCSVQDDRLVCAGCGATHYEST